MCRLYMKNKLHTSEVRELSCMMNNERHTSEDLILLLSTSLMGKFDQGPGF